MKVAFTGEAIRLLIQIAAQHEPVPEVAGEEPARNVDRPHIRKSLQNPRSTVQQPLFPALDLIRLNPELTR